MDRDSLKGTFERKENNLLPPTLACLQQGKKLPIDSASRAQSGLVSSLFFRHATMKP